MGPPLHLRIPLIYAITELPVIYTRFPLADSFTHGTVYVSPSLPVHLTTPLNSFA